MNGKPCASPGIATCWEEIDWQKARAYVKKLQMRIVKAQKEGHYSKVKSLQWLLTHSFYAKALAVKRVTSNSGKRTSGVDHELWLTQSQNSTGGGIAPNRSDGTIFPRKTEKCDH